MHLVGRHVLVRPHGARGIGPRLVLSQPRAQWDATVTRYTDEDFAVLPSGLAVPAIRGGAGWSAGAQLGFVYAAPEMGASVSQSTLALDSAYTNGSAGDAIAALTMMPASLTLNNVYFFITGYTGTAANVNDINVEICTQGSGKPNSTPAATGSVDPASATGWIKTTGFTQAMTVDTPYWTVVGDADGGGTDYATVLRNVTATQEGRSRTAAFQTTDGWATVVTGTTAQSGVVLNFSNSTSIGWPITANAAPSNNTNRRGWNLSAGLTDTIKFYGMLLGSGNSLTSSSGLEVWADDAGPSGSADGSTTTRMQTSVAGATTTGYVFAPSTGYTLLESTPYRIVFTFSGNSTSVGRRQIGTGADAGLRAAIWGGGNHYWAQANGTTDWSNDNISEYPQAMLLFEDQVAPTAGGGGGGGPLVGNRLVIA
jgi:hypothetical protein